MSGSSRPHTPTFRFYGAGDSDRNSTDGQSRTPDSSLPRQFLGSPGSPNRRLSPRARSASPRYDSEDLSNFSFTFADGWIGIPPSAFDRVEDLRSSLPATEPRNSSTTAPPPPFRRLLLSSQAAEAPYELEHPPAAPKNGFTLPAASGSDPQQPADFSLRLLHNATPLPSREPSPQPGESAAVVLRPRPRHQSRASDVSVFSDEAESPPPYDVRSEGAPAHEFFTARFQSTLREGLEIAKDTLKVLEKLDSHVRDDADLKKLLNDAYQLSAFEGSDTKTIAVLGDSGEGMYVLNRLRVAPVDAVTYECVLTLGREEQSHQFPARLPWDCQNRTPSLPSRLSSVNPSSAHSSPG